VAEFSAAIDLLFDNTVTW